jgi:hypothetical protein
MTGRAMRLIAGVVAAGALGATGQAALAAGAAPSSGESCFLSRDWESWKSPSPSVILVRVGVNRVFRLELQGGSSQLQDGGVHLVSKIRGSDWICSPLDLDLTLADDHGGFREPLIVKSMRQLTPDEIKDIPAKYRP